MRAGTTLPRPLCYAAFLTGALLFATFADFSVLFYRPSVGHRPSLGVLIAGQSRRPETVLDSNDRFDVLACPHP